MASRGGKARAKQLTARQRSKIAAMGGKATAGKKRNKKSSKKSSRNE